MFQGLTAICNTAIPFVRGDWDMHQSDDVRTSRKIPRRSTLLLLTGDTELGRIVAETSVVQIKAPNDKAL